MILNMQLHTNITSHKDWLLKLKDFCSSQGWTIDSYLTDVDWVGPAPYSFQAGSEDYLAVSSAGYGNQSLFFRMVTDPDGVDPDNSWVKLGGHFNNTLDTASATHPVDRNAWNNKPYVGAFPPSGFPAAWFFGNDKFILVVSKLDGVYVEYFTFGSLELFDTAESEANWLGWNRASTAFEWYDKTVVNPFDQNGDNIYWGGVRKPAADSIFNFTLTGSTNNFSNTAFFSYGRQVVTNDESEIRPLVKQILYIKDTVDSHWFPLAQVPVYRIRNDGFAIGEKVKYGNDEYLVFPYSRQNEYFNGIAVRVA